MFSIVILCLLVFALVDYKKSYFLFLFFQIFWYPSAKFFYPLTSAFNQIPLYLIASIGYLAIHFFQKKQCCHFFYLTPIIILCLTHFITSFFSLEGFANEIFRAIGYASNLIGNIYLINCYVNKKDDIVFLLKGLTICYCFVTAYGLIEYFLQYNTILSYKSTLTPEGLWVYSIDIYRGYRLCTVFEHPIGAGMNLSLFVFFSLFCLFVLKLKISKKWRLLILLICIISACEVFLTKMRSCIVFLLIGCIGFLSLKNRKQYLVLALGVFGILIVCLLSEQVQGLFLSLFSGFKSDNVGGSSLSMRLSQMETVIKISKLSPIFGLGERFADFLPSNLIAGGLAFESVWFEVVCKFGFLGTLATLCLILYSCFLLPIKCKSKPLFFISSAYWIVYSLTSVPFFRDSFFYLILIVIVKYSFRLLKKSEISYSKKIRKTCFA